MTYRIDFVARNPDDPGRFALAIECDGASYHSAESARDRDRLRQEHLERLGWRFHRIWSTEWWRNKPAEVERAWAALEHSVATVKAANEREEPPERAPQSAPTPAAEPRALTRDPPPQIYGELPIDEYSDADIARVVDYLASDRVLRSNDEMLAAVMLYLGFKRRGTKIVRRLGAVIAGRAVARQSR